MREELINAAEEIILKTMQEYAKKKIDEFVECLSSKSYSTDEGIMVIDETEIYNCKNNLTFD